MAVAIEFVNVIVRKSAVEKEYPGGLDGFVRQELPNYLEDEHLVRVGFMSSRDASGFVEQLKAAGLCYSDHHAPDVAILTGTEGAAAPWLSVGECEGRAACWLSDHPPGKLIDLDPAMLLRCSVFASVGEIAGVLCEGGNEVRERGVNAQGSGDAVLDCVRRDARIEVEVFTDPKSGRPVGIWGRRDLTRRDSIEADVALMRDLTSTLIGSGAEVP